MRWLPRLAAGAAVALAVGLAALLAGRSDTGPAAVSSTSPADGVTLARAPATVELTFTRAVDPSRSHISVAGPARTAGVPRRPAPERLSQPITATAGGEVTVAYHVTFTDGAELVGSLRFVARPGKGLVAQPGNAAGRQGDAASRQGDAAGRQGDAAGRQAEAAAHQHDIDPVSAGLLVADGIALLVVGVLLVRRPRPRATGGR